MGLKNATRTAAHGRWPSILVQFGFNKKQLSGVHQACPMCGGTDRWRFSNHDGHGSYFCSGCGPGSGFDLLMKVKGWDFKTAAAEVDKLVNAGAVSSEPEIFEPTKVEEKRRRDLNALWAQGTPQLPPAAVEYLSGRGLHSLLALNPALFADCRYNPTMFHKELDDKIPGLMWLVRNAAGRPISIHRTYLQNRDKKLMPPTENLKGSGIRFGPVSQRYVIGEGIETTLSGCQWFECSGMAVISAGMMEEAQVPTGIDDVIILADNDKSFTGQKAAFTLARRLDNRNDLKRVVVVMPTEPGADFNDIRPIRGMDLPYRGWTNE